jgi:hypothetical protein
MDKFPESAGCLPVLFRTVCENIPHFPTDLPHFRHVKIKYMRCFNILTLSK